MPFSLNFFDNDVIKHIKKYQYKYYIDIGTGAGKYGSLIKNIVDDSYITGIEIDKKYITKFKLHKIYDEIICDKAENMIIKYPNLITECAIIGDCIEHLKKSDGINLINYLVYRTKKIIIVFPSKYIQYAYDGHQHESHVSIWSKYDFGGFEFKYYKKQFLNLVIINGYLNDNTSVYEMDNKWKQIYNQFC